MYYKKVNNYEKSGKYILILNCQTCEKPKYA